MQKLKIRKIKINKIVAENILKVILGFILTKCMIFGLVLPFGISMSAVMCSRKNSIACGVGSFFGYLFLSSDQFNFKYAGATLIVIAVLNFKKLNPILVSFIVTFGTNIVYLFSTNLTLENLLQTIISSILALSFAYFYDNFISRTLNAKIYRVSLLFFAVSILLSLLRFEIFFGIVPIRILAVIIILATTYLSKNGIIMAVILGITIDSYINQAIFTLGYSFASIISGGLRVFNKTIYAAVFMIMYSVGSVFSVESPLFYIGLYEVFIASLIFVFIPTEKLEFIKDFDDDYNMGVSSMTREASHIIDELGKIFTNSVTTINDVEYSDIQKIYDKTIDNVCKNCNINVTCWHKNYTSSLDALNQASGKLILNGYAKSSDFPKYFSTRCVKFPQFLGSINDSLTSLNKNIKTNESFLQHKLLISEQYKALSSVLNDISRKTPVEYFPDISNKIYEYLKYHSIICKVSAYNNTSGRLFLEFIGDDLTKLHKKVFIEGIDTLLCKKFEFDSQVFKENTNTIILKEKNRYKIDIKSKIIAKEKLAGDNFTSFETAQSKFNIILSDGMGSGKKANEESIQILNLLSKMLKTSVPVIKAINIINPVINIKNDENSFVSLDLTSLDLISLDGIIVKQGAMPTLIYRDGALHKIAKTNLPLGISDKAFISRVKFKLHDIVILMSDGLDDVLYDDILGILLEYPDMQTVCNQIIQKSQNIDDKTVIAFKIKLNK